MKKLIAIVSVLILAALLAFRFKQAHDRARPAEADEKIFAVQTAPVETKNLPRVITLTGNIRPLHEVDIAAKIGGRIEKIVADLGDRVRAGSTLASIEHREIALQVKQAEAGLAAARANFHNADAEAKRGAKLQVAGALSDSQYEGMLLRREAAAAQLAQAEASLALAREALRNATLTSPIAGTVTRRGVNLGQLVAPGIPIYQVQEFSIVKFTAGVDAAEVGALAKGMPVRVAVDAFPEELFEGSIARISPALDPMTRRAIVEVEIPNSQQRLLPNMFARGIVEVGRSEDATVVPSVAVIEEGTRHIVYVVEQGKATRKEVQLGFTGEKYAVLQSGVTPGEKVVIAGQELLRDGARVAER